MVTTSNKEVLIQVSNKNKIDYDNLKKNNVVLIRDSEDFYDVNFFITARGRKEFSKPMYESFKAAADRSNLKISYTIIEHSEAPQHAKFCNRNNLNYIWIKSKPNELFNKCLAYNSGAFFAKKSKYLLFHDIDCLVQSDFFIKLFENISNQKARAIQCFTKRRVLYISDIMTPKVVSGEILVDELSIEKEYISPPGVLGAPGGSIMVERDLFFDVGGYDADYFLANSPEDAFFWNKIDTLDKMYTSNDPDIEIYHMWHRPTWNDNPHLKDMKQINTAFEEMTKDEKLEIIYMKSEMIEKFR